jgi:hypothetical protein
MQVASMSANGDGVTTVGEITRQENRYVVTVEGERLGPAGSIQAAAERLAHGLRAHLPPNPANVQASCAKEGLSIAVGNRAGGGGGGELHPCSARVLGRRRLESLQEALSAFARSSGIAVASGG